MIDLSHILRDPTAAAALAPDERARVLQQCAALILAVSSVPAQIQPTAPDRLLTPQQVAERLNLSTAWVYEHAATDLAPARVKVGRAVRAVRFSSIALDEIIRQRNIE